MPQDAFHIKRISEELNNMLSGGKVNRISQVDKDEITLIIYTGNGTLKLILNTNASFARVVVQKTEKAPLLVPPSFCMLLRKHLSGGEIVSVKQVENERIIAITFLCFNDFSGGEKVLYAELMGKYSNLILTEKGVILGALKSTPLENSVGRILLSGAKYALPLPQEKLQPTNLAAIEEKWAEFTGGGENSATDYYSEVGATFLFESVAGIALPTARKIMEAARKNKVSYTGFPSFFVEFYLREPTFSTLEKGGSGYVDFFAFSFSGGEKAGSLNEAEAIYYTRKDEQRLFNEKRTKLTAITNAKIKKCEKNLADTLHRLKEAESAEKNKIKGELITANIYKIKKGETLLTAENWYENGKEEKITLDKTLSPAANAQRYFKLYTKEKRTITALTPRKEAEEKELSYFRSVLIFIAEAENIDDLRETEEELKEIGLLPQEKAKKKKTEESVPFRKYVFEGFTILSGRNNLSNDRLLKSLDGEDIWLHTQKIHSAHVGILCENKKVPENVLLFAAEICAHYSEAKNGEKVAVDYTKRKYVKKPKKAAAGFVFYTDYKTLYVQGNAHEKERIE